MKDALIHGYNDNSLEAVAILFSFSTVIVVVFTIGLATSQPQVLDPVISVRYGFQLVKQAINPIRKWLVSPMLFDICAIVEPVCVCVSIWRPEVNIK